MTRIRRSDTDRPPYYLLIEKGDWGGVVHARSEGASWGDLRTSLGMSALGVAILEGSPLVVQTLLEIGAPVSTQQQFDGTPYSPMWAVLDAPDSSDPHRRSALLDLCLQAGCDPNELHPSNSERPSALAYVSEQGWADETILLCKAGAIPNTETPPSPLWLWIRHLEPQPNDDDLHTYHFPDSRPLLALLKAGAWVHGDEAGVAGLGVSELDLARRRWLEHRLSRDDQERVSLTLALMDQNALNRAAGLSELPDPERDQLEPSRDGGRGKSSKQRAV